MAGRSLAWGGRRMASVAIKLLAATHLLWTGLSIGVVLAPAQYRRSTYSWSCSWAS